MFLFLKSFLLGFNQMPSGALGRLSDRVTYYTLLKTGLFFILIGLTTFVGTAGTFTTNTYTFSYANRTAIIAAGWDFIAKTALGASRNTESTNGATPPDISYDQTAHPGSILIPVIRGDIWDRSTNDLRYPLINNSSNSLFRSLSTNWVSLRLDASYRPQYSYEQVNLTLYQDDDNFVSVAHEYNTYEQISMSLQTLGYSLGSPRTINPPAQGVASADIQLRLDRDTATDKVTGYYSLDGTNWVAIGETTHALVNPRICVWAGGFPAGSNSCTIRKVVVVTSDDAVIPVITAQPQQLVFNAIQGQPCTNVQQLRVISRVTQDSLNLTVTNNNSWLSLVTASNSTPAIFDVSVNTSNLAVGTYVGVIQFGRTNTVAGTATVKLIVNPSTRAKVATWQGGKAGAMTVWVDDSHTVAFDSLYTNGFAGTYALWGVDPIPGIFTNYYVAGMEMASHTIDHPCFEVNEPTRRYEFEKNITEIITKTPATQAEVISFAWPCGVNTIKEQAMAGDYFLVSRGYDFNQLEDASPKNWMNVKSYNSHGGTPSPPADFKTLVTAAIQQGKWVNFVFHNTFQDDGAISFALGKDIWVARADSVAKYIHQRDRTVVTNYSEASDYIQFETYRLPIASTAYRSFETSLKSNDVLTMKVDVTGYTGKYVSSVMVGGSGVTFTNIGTTNFFDIIVTTNSQAVVVNFQTNTPSVLPAQFNISINELTTMVVTNTATDSDIPAQSLSYTLVVTNTIDNTVVGNASISSSGVIAWTPTELQGPGTYSFTTVVNDNAPYPVTATNSFVVTVNEVNVAPTLPAQTTQMTFGTNPFVFSNAALDPDIPINQLFYSLTAVNTAGNTPITNATINASGIISWTPTLAQMSSTNLFTTIVADTNGVAVNATSLKATNSFVVILLPNALTLATQTNRNIDELSQLLVTNGAVNLTNLTRSGWIATNRTDFNYANRNALVADGWSFWATNSGGVGRNTEITDTNVSVIQFSQTNSSLGVVTRMPCDLGDMWSSLNDTRDSMFRNVSTNWMSARLNLSFDPSQNYQQAHLIFYQNDDNYVEVGIGFNSGSKNNFFIQETNGQPVVLNSTSLTATNLALRLDHNLTNGNISAFFSLDGTNWVAMGQIGHTLVSPRLGVWTGASTTPYSTTLKKCDLAWLDVVTTNTPPPLLYTLSVTNTENNTLVTNVSIDTSGIISWTPTEVQGPGVYSFTTIANEGALNATNVFIVTVNEVNLLPVFIATPPNSTVSEGSLFTVTNAATDADLPLNPLTYHLVGAPGNAAINASGVITWTPSETEGSTTNLIVTVVDDGVTTVANSFTVIVNELNSIPTLTVPPNTNIMAMSPWIGQATAVDADLPVNSLTFQLVSGPPTLTVASNGLVNWTPAQNQANTTNLVRLRVTDFNPTAVNSTSLSVTSSFTIAVGPVLVVTVNNTNRAFGNPNPLFTVGYAGFVNGDNSSVLQGSLAFSSQATNTSPVGVYPVQVSGVSSAYYSIVFASGQMSISASNAPVSLSGLSQVYDGHGKSATATTTPSGLTVSMTYNGSATVPTNVGSYQVVGTIVELNYVGSATNTMSISASNAPVSLSGLSQIFNGTSRVVTAATVPSGLAVNITYNGSATGPTNAGSYQVIATINESNFVGSVTNTLTVTNPDPIVLSLRAGSLGTVVISWNSVSNLTYRVQYKNNLTDANWTDLPPDIIATGVLTSVTNVVGIQPQRFFRVYQVGNLSTSNTQPVILSLKAGSVGEVVVSWNSVSNQVYHLQFKSSLSDTNWTNLLPSVTATGTMTSVTNSVGSQPQRFFRLYSNP